MYTEYCKPQSHLSNAAGEHEDIVSRHDFGAPEGLRRLQQLEHDMVKWYLECEEAERLSRQKQEIELDTQ